MKYLFSIGLAFLALLCHSCQQNKEKPNVIIIITDDQGYGDMSCHGNPWLKTPEMDKLHDQSVRLTDFHVDPTCAPSRAAVMTGRYASRTGVWLTYGSRNHLRRDEKTMADVFSQNGYETAIFGKWHLGDNYPFRPMDRGFKESLIHGGGVIGETPDYWDNNYYDDIYMRNGHPEKVKGYCTDVWFNETIKFMDKNKDKPFFIYLSTNAPHGPLNVPEKYRKPYANNPATKNRAEYYGMLANIDENLGRLQDYLNKNKLDKNTIVVYLNDNGTNAGVVLDGDCEKSNRNGWKVAGYNAGMRGRKTSRYEGGHRAACFIRWPQGNLLHGQDINVLSAHIDLLPTLADLCTLSNVETLPLDGVSLKDVLMGNKEELEPRTLVVHDQGRFGQAVGDGHLIKYKDFSVMKKNWRLVGDELYDVKSDPAQKNNIVHEHPELVKQLKRSYEQWWSGISQKSEEYCPFVVNPDKQKVIKISSQNLMGDQVAYSQRMVRAGMPSNGYTMIDVEKPGEYIIILARYDIESGIAMVDVAPNYPMHPSTHKMKKQNNKALDIKEVRLKVGGFEGTKPVCKEDKSIQFKVNLSKGIQKIQTWMIMKDGSQVAAYYTYIKANNK